MKFTCMGYKEQIGGIAINRFTDIDRAVEAWLEHPSLHIGAFDSNAAAAPQQHQVDLGTLVSGPEVRLVRAQRLEDFLDRVAFPRGTDLGMKFQVAPATDAQQRVQEHHENPADDAVFS